MKICKNLLSHYTLKKLLNLQNINIYLLSIKSEGSIKGMRLLDELINSNTALVKELDHNERIDRVKIYNNSFYDLLLLSGDIIIGAKQNRMIMDNTIIKSKNNLEVPVSCVEKNRWHYQSNRNFNASDIKISPKIRASKDRFYENDYTNSIQGKIWDDIEKISKKSNYNSSSRNYCDFIQKDNNFEKKEYEKKINNSSFNAYIVEGVGKVFFEYFFSEKIAKKSLLKSIPSYLIDQDNINLNETKVLDLNLLRYSEWKKTNNIGSGSSYAVNEKNSGKAIVFNNKMVHLYYYFE